MREESKLRLSYRQGQKHTTEIEEIEKMQLDVEVSRTCQCQCQSSMTMIFDLTLLFVIW